MTRTKTRAQANWPNNAVSVLDFGAVGDGVTDDTAAIQAAIDSFGPRANNVESGVELYFPSGNYYITSTITIAAGQHGIGLKGVTGHGSLIQTDKNIIMFRFNDDMSADEDHALKEPLYHCSIENLYFRSFSTDNTDQCQALQLNRTQLSYIEHCLFRGFYRAIDSYRTGELMILACEFRHASTRKTPNSQFMRLNGVKDSTSTHSTGGGTHITDCEFWGGDGAYYTPMGPLLEVTTVDGLYITQCHFTASADSQLFFNPGGNYYINAITDVKVQNCYFDNGKGHGGMDAYVKVGGTLTTDMKIYQDILFSNCKFRCENGGARNSVMVKIDTGTLTASEIEAFSKTTKNLSFDQCEFLQSYKSSLIVYGSSQGYLTWRSISVTDCFFEDNNYEGDNLNSDISGDAASWTINGCTFAPSHNEMDNCIKLDTSDADTYSKAILLSSNNFGQANLSSSNENEIAPYKFATSKNMRVVITDNVMPQTGQTIKDTYTTSTSNWSGGRPFLFKATVGKDYQAYHIEAMAIAVATNGDPRRYCGKKRWFIGNAGAANALQQWQTDTVFESTGLTSNGCPLALINLSNSLDNWKASTSYVAGDAIKTSSNKAYLCVTSGTSASSGSGPSGSGAEVNGTARFVYVSDWEQNKGGFALFVSGESDLNLDWSISVELISAN